MLGGFAMSGSGARGIVHPRAVLSVSFPPFGEKQRIKAKEQKKDGVPLARPI